MTLNAAIQERLAQARAHVPPAAFAGLAAVFDRLERARVGVDAPKPGSRAPNAAVVAADGRRTLVADLHVRRTLVLVFYRGRWCPFCDLTLRAYDAVVEELVAAGAAVVAVSPQTADETAATASERSLRFPLYSDPQNAAAQAFGLAWALTPDERELYRGFGSDLEIANGDNRWELPAPAVFVIDAQGVVQWAWTDADWTRRAEPEDVLAAVRLAAPVGQSLPPVADLGDGGV